MSFSDSLPAVKKRLLAVVGQFPIHRLIGARKTSVLPTTRPERRPSSSSMRFGPEVREARSQNLGYRFREQVYQHVVAR